MSKSQAKKPEQDAEEPVTEETVETEAADEAVADAAIDAAEALEPVLDEEDYEVLRLAELEGEISQLKDQLLRALAETENLRRRHQREREDASKYAAAGMAKDILGVADNLTRALESVDPEAAQNEAVQTLLAGVELTQRELSAAFDRHHIVKLDPVGEKLDPHRHEAMFEVPGTDQPAGTVVQVFEFGYLLHDRLLRPARVGVAKAAPKEAAAKADEDEAES